MVGSEHVGDYCVRSPVCAEPWQPLSLVRQQMLSSSFSFLPIRIDLGEGKKWYVVSDLELARVLCNPDRKVTLGTTVCDAVSRFGLKLPEPQTVEVEASIFSVLQHSGGLPILVVDEACNLVGIATPFDLL